jgi:phosphinothricin acetyltransferase
MNIRFARPQDQARIIAIYNEAIRAGRFTADTSPITLESRGDWFAEHGEERHPIYVEEHEGEIRGWCSLSQYRSGRPALRHTAEISYYVSMPHWRKGIATSLVNHALSDCPRLQIKTVFAVLLDTNQGSINLLKKHGFEPWGHLPNVADFGEFECGHLYLGKRVG